MDEEPTDGVWVNVKDYGAKGDGITDDTAAIQTAINVLDCLGGGTAFVSDGTYRVDADIRTDE